MLSVQECRQELEQTAIGKVEQNIESVHSSVEGGIDNTMNTEMNAFGVSTYSEIIVKQQRENIKVPYASQHGNYRTGTQRPRDI